MNNDYYPLLFEPVLKDYIWGGRTLEKLGRKLPPEGLVAESWEIAGHEDGTTAVRNGRFAGQPLTEVQAQLGLDLIGSNNAWALEHDKFPLLIKLLDASRPLSVQVHPKDDYALAHEGNELGKTEMWVVLDAQPGAELILGVRQGTTAQNFRQAIDDGNLEPYLHHVPVKKGDHVCVPAGTLHAIMGGILIAEIQQNSNTTYRVYDWNRVGADGKPRMLHIDQSLDVINFEQVEPQLSPPILIDEENGVRRERLCTNEYFVTERVTMAEGAVFSGECDGRTLEIWGVLEGTAVINDVALEAIQFCLLPAALGAYTVVAETEAVLLRTYVE
ncbi:MAG: type I phosphomannose isomerase catalytic subunit [Candidatus Promineifilaceae bacterium]|jgi:mannose-6-phosphate isomerase